MSEFNPLGSGAGIVDQRLGNAYQVVKHVADNLDAINMVAALADDASIVKNNFAIILAGVSNFRATYAEAITAFAVDSYFTSAASGQLRLYKRISTTPFYADQGDVVAPVSKALLLSSAGAVQIGTINSGTGAVARTQQSKNNDIVNVTDFMTPAQITDVMTDVGLLDVTAAVQAAINSKSGFIEVRFPAGTLNITSTVTVAQGRITLSGAGAGTRIKFSPTANATCFKFDNGSTTLVQNVVRDIVFYSNDTTYTKIAIEMYDASQCLIENVQSMYPHWYGAGSTGLQLRGRDNITVSKFEFFANKPIRISPIQAPHTASGIGLDQTVFRDLYIYSPDSPLITIDDGMPITNVTFDGRQAWAGGTHGLYWNAPTVIANASLKLSINNVRWEQQLAGGGYLAYIVPADGITGLQINNCYSGDNAVSANSVYLRNVQHFSIINHTYIGVTTGLNIDNTNSNGVIDVFQNNPNSTFTLTATRLSGTLRQGGNVFSYTPSAPTGSAVTQKWNPSKTLGFNQLEPQTFAVAASTITPFALDTLTGLVFIYSSAAVSAVMAVNGTSHSTRLLIASDAGWFGTAVGAANHNIYWDAGTSKYVIQNIVASPIIFYVCTMGQGER